MNTLAISAANVGGFVLQGFNNLSEEFDDWKVVINTGTCGEGGGELEENKKKKIAVRKWEEIFSHEKKKKTELRGNYFLHVYVLRRFTTRNYVRVCEP